VSVVVSPVNGWRDRREFVELPFRLHSTSGVWVPPLRLERHLFLMRSQNPLFSHGDAQLFLARRDGRVVGRISAQYDDNFNAFHNNRWGMFGFLEFEDAPDIVPALLEAAWEWLRARGRDHAIGPMDFTLLDESGVMIEGFDRKPFIRQPWHPPYYAKRCEEAGLTKEVDLLMYELEISDRSKILPVVFKLAAEVGPRHGIKIRRMSRRSLRRDLDRFAEVYNAAWRENWGFVPYTKRDLDVYANELQLVFDPNWFMVAETASGETAAIAITVPDVNQVLEKMKGRLLPFGWWHYLRKSRTIDRVRVGFLGVHPKYQHTGVAAALYVEHFDTATRVRQKWGEMGWILETNRNMNRAMEAMGGRVVRRFRVYGHDL
jgi:GNAT superfamily N-acetyltransferase